MRQERNENGRLYDGAFADLGERGEDTHYEGDLRDRGYPDFPTFAGPYLENSYRSGQLAGFTHGDRIENISDYGSVGRYNSQGPRGLGQFRYRQYPLPNYRHGPHRGKGPKSYKRSDERIREDICNRMTDNRYLDASEVEVEVQDGNVVLTGLVDGRYEKRLAADLGETAYGVKNVENRLRIKDK